MKLTKTHNDLLADVAAGNVWRTGGHRNGVSTVERPGAKVKDVTVPMAALHEQFLVTLGRAESQDPKRQRRQYRLTTTGEAQVSK